MPAGLAGQFQVVLFQSHYVWFVSGFQLVGGVLLPVNRYVVLALTILGPVIVNILLYHLLLDRTRGVVDCGCDSVGIAGLSLPPILLWAIRPTSVLGGSILLALGESRAGVSIWLLVIRRYSRVGVPPAGADREPALNPKQRGE